MEDLEKSRVYLKGRNPNNASCATVAFGGYCSKTGVVIKGQAGTFFGKAIPLMPVSGLTSQIRKYVTFWTRKDE